MSIKTFKLPDPGEGLVEAEIVEWKVAAGETVTVNQIILEIETAKSLVELPCPWAGTVEELLVEVGATVDVGTPIISIDDGKDEPPAPAAGTASGEAGRAAAPGDAEDGGAAAQATLVGYGDRSAARSGRRARKDRPAPGPRPVRSLVQTSFDPELAAVEPEHPGQQAMWDRAALAEATDPFTEVVSMHEGYSTPAGERPKAKPPVRKYAKDRDVDLTRVRPSGPDGAVTREDIDSFLADQGAAPTSPTAPTVAVGAPPSAPATPAHPGAINARGESRTPVKGVRKMTAQAMVGSAFTAPHVTEWVTVDVSAAMELIERLRADREFRDAKVTPMLVLAKAMCVAIRRHPEINAAWDGRAQEIAVRHYVNLGIAAATPRGLIVPNIKDADLLSMRELADAIADLTAVAREGRTPPGDMARGTITITNVGVFGVDAGTPIINPGESAILCFGAIRRQPWVVTAADGSESIEPRWVTQLALSFDHRLVDGELGSRFLADVAAILNDPARGLVWG